MEQRAVRWWHPQLLGAHVIALVLVSVAISLGVWQYDAWQARRAAERVDLTEAAPVPLQDLIGPDDPFPRAGLGRPVEVAGTWLPEGTVLVSGREAADGADGSWVVTPLTDGDATAPAIPVVRGWVPAGTDPADVPAPGETGELVGWLQPGEGTGETDPDPSDDVLPQVRIADLVQRVDQDLYGAYVVAEEPEPGLAAATLDQMPEVSRFTGLRNILYAIEWWVFASFAAFLWWRYVREALQEARRDAGGEAGPDGSGDEADAGDDSMPAQGDPVASES
ncbi:SURF1 family protein [Nocardioides sp. GY 10113]|uniref:SURF1 family protein n=1 Tax=Nocardioides sp. GY 10113 TaxID=2569761 RepID=UPI0010A8F189|nr:SURF1 family protein [Nocardioides sp. GY 10113]TIC89086.1 SURF1 family protein [Nocardioides sp. GY 10113]